MKCNTPEKVHFFILFSFAFSTSLVSCREIQEAAEETGEEIEEVAENTGIEGNDDIWIKY